MDIRQKILLRRSQAEKALTAAEAAASKHRNEIALLDDLIRDEEDGNRRIREPAQQVDESRTSNGTFGTGKTAQAMVDELKKAGGELSLIELVNRMIASGFGVQSERPRIANNVTSVFYRALKNPNHPLFRKAGRGAVKLAKVEV